MRLLLVSGAVIAVGLYALYRLCQRDPIFESLSDYERQEQAKGWEGPRASFPWTNQGEPWRG